MQNIKKRRDRKNCKYYRKRGKATAYCDYLGKGQQCYKVCNFFVDSRIEELLQPDVKSQVCGKCGHPNDSNMDWCKKCYDDYYSED